MLEQSRAAPGSVRSPGHVRARSLAENIDGNDSPVADFAVGLTASESSEHDPDQSSGTVAHVLITIDVIVTALVFAFTEHGSGARRLFGVAFGGALALGALSFMTAVGWAGATF